MSTINEVVFLAAARTAIGGFGGGLKDMPPSQLGALVLKEVISRAGVEASEVESCIVGNVIRTEPKDAYLSRLIALGGGLDSSSQALTVNRLCGSGLEAIVLAAQQIQLGETRLAVAGGAEVMSRSSYSLPSNRWGQRMGPSTVHDDMLGALTCPFIEKHMGITAENLAEQFGIGRDEQDIFAEESHRRAVNAIKHGYFKDQIMPVELKTRKGVTVFDTDEHPRADVSKESLSKLRPAFDKEGSVTAGNASGLNDGAAMVVVASADYAAEKGLKPMARLLGYARAGVDPSIMGTGPIPAVSKALKSAGLSVADMDVIESNEAFAVQACAVSRELGFPEDKTNPNGGAVGLGHPIGATGAVLTTKAIYELHRTGGKYGFITMCIGGGQGFAAVFEAL
jgi:acetyl-CoA C-acetyltransferase